MKHLVASILFDFIPINFQVFKLRKVKTFEDKLKTFILDKVDSKVKFLEIREKVRLRDQHSSFLCNSITRNINNQKLGKCLDIKKSFNSIILKIILRKFENFNLAQERISCECVDVLRLKFCVVDVDHFYVLLQLYLGKSL